MAEASDTEGILRQNLIDAGCDLGIVQQCMELARGQRTEEMKRILTRHRRTLLDTVHAEEKKIDFILAVGGGSVIDCCKAVSMAAVYEGDLWNDFFVK